jgi:hypothetical protein
MASDSAVYEDWRGLGRREVFARYVQQELGAPTGGGFLAYHRLRAHEGTHSRGPRFFGRYPFHRERTEMWLGWLGKLVAIVLLVGGGVHAALRLRQEIGESMIRFLRENTNCRGTADRANLASIGALFIHQPAIKCFLPVGR